MTATDMKSEFHYIKKHGCPYYYLCLSEKAPHFCETKRYIQCNKYDKFRYYNTTGIKDGILYCLTNPCSKCLEYPACSRIDEVFDIISLINDLSSDSELKCYQCNANYPVWIFIAAKTHRIVKICELCLIPNHPVRHPYQHEREGYILLQ